MDNYQTSMGINLICLSKNGTALWLLCYAGCMMKCYYEDCKESPIWYIFVDPGTYACDEHAPADYIKPL